MRHEILGPGGVGGFIAAVLADAGEQVTLIVRPETESRYPTEISLESPFRSIRAHVAVTPRASMPLDVLWVTIKATQLSAALESIPNDFQVEAVVPLLNGINHVDLLRQRFGHDRVIPATIAVESERIAPGKIVHRSPFARLSIAANGLDRLASVLPIFEGFGCECSVVDDEATLLWRKLVFLAPIALATTAARGPIGEVLGDPHRAAQLEALVHEACEVAVRSGATVNVATVLSGIKTLPPTIRSSMEKDVTRGLTPELDAIAGPILHGAQKFGIVAAATQAAVQQVDRLRNSHCCEPTNKDL